MKKSLKSSAIANTSCRGFLNSNDGLRNTGVAPIHGYRNEMSVNVNFVAGTAIALAAR